MMPSTGSPQRRVVKKLHLTIVSLVWRLSSRFSMSGSFLASSGGSYGRRCEFSHFDFPPWETPCLRAPLSMRSFVGSFPRKARTAEGGEAVFPPRTPGALARCLHGAEAIRVSLDPLNAADQPGQITEVFTQCVTLHHDRMCPVMMDSHMIL
jgi:hypothetical protein